MRSTAATLSCCPTPASWSTSFGPPQTESEQSPPQPSLAG
jgi:hypothetical protein